mmetsp:Transcript_9762/g.39658  ORF Transcript_9762/g.39658 Transcript_9762/m.39658 type:complete len:221 (-) Transcript_9762:71-733(-)
MELAAWMEETNVCCFFVITTLNDTPEGSLGLSACSSMTGSSIRGSRLSRTDFFLFLPFTGLPTHSSSGPSSAMCSLPSCHPRQTTEDSFSCSAVGGSVCTRPLSFSSPALSFIAPREEGSVATRFFLAFSFPFPFPFPLSFSFDKLSFKWRTRFLSLPPMPEACTVPGVHLDSRNDFLAQLLCTLMEHSEQRYPWIPRPQISSSHRKQGTGVRKCRFFSR